MFRRVMISGLMAAALLLGGCGGKQSQPSLEATATQQGTSLVVQVKTTGFTVGKDGHVHIYINDGPEAMLYGYTYTVENMEPGAYKIRVELANRRHENIGVGQTLQLEMAP